MRRELTDTECRATRGTLLDRQEAGGARTFKLPREKRTIKLTDGGGMYLEVPPNDQRGWRWTYTRPKSSDKAGKPNVLSLGTYPEISLAVARERCDAARKMVANNIDPSEHKAEVARAVDAANAALFQKIANDWWAEVIAPHCGQTTRDRYQTDFDNLIEKFGHRPIAGIEPYELGEFLRVFYGAGNTAKTRRHASMASRIWCYAITEKHCKYDIAATFLKDRFKHKRGKMPAITDKFDETQLPEMETAVGELLTKIDGYNDNRAASTRAMRLTRHALFFMAYSVPRPINVRRLEWKKHIMPDPTRPGRRIALFTPDDMKMDKPLRVPLSTQAEAILDALEPFTGKGKYVFSTSGKPMGKNTLTRALARLGYNTETEQSAHGFRTVFGTLATEWGGYTEDAIELSLAHRDEDQIRGIYTKAGMWDERCRLMQHYADRLDVLRAGGHVGPPQQVAANVVHFDRRKAA